MVYRKTAATAARKDARHKMILDAATRMFGAHGYHAATVPMIVADAGSSVGSFYAHFRNKEDVFAAVLEELGQRITNVLSEAKACEDDSVQRIPGAVKALFLFLAENPREARILIVESSGLSPRLEAVRRGILSAHAEQVHHALEAEKGGASSIDPAIAARCLVGGVYEALYSWLDQDPAHRPPAEDVACAVADYNTRALGGV